MARQAVTFVIVLISCGAWFGLAILGFGGFAAFFANNARIALAAIILLLVVASVFTSGNLSSGQQEDRGNRWVLAVFFVLGLLDGWLPAWSDRNEVWILDGDTSRWCGVLLFAAGGALRIWPVFVLGRRFSGLVAIQPGHTLQTTGIYRHIRNPSYLGVVAMTLGWGLAFRSGLGVLITVLFIPALVARMDAEEALLLKQFGAEYEAYRTRTSRLIPGLY